MCSWDKNPRWIFVSDILPGNFWHTKVTGSLNFWVPILHNYVYDIIGDGNEFLDDGNEGSGKKM